MKGCHRFHTVLPHGYGEHYKMDENQVVGDELDGIMPESELSEDPAVSTAQESQDASSEAQADTVLPESTSEPVPDTPEPSVEVIGIRFKKSGKIYYFDPDGGSFISDMNAIVETARGIEYGNVALGNRMVPASEIVPPLRKVIRASTPEDDKKHEENSAREKEAFEVCVKKINEHSLEMKLIDVEYTFDNNKLLFYFTADGRIDFRDLVKDLASVFRTRIELRQIGIRDEAKMLGGLGICGRPFCCSSFLGDFVQVSIKMAKDQSLSLNSAKISGSCGRLMCCLRYEYDTYEEELRKTPKLESIVTTPDGDGTVIEVRPLSGQVRVRLFKDPDQPPKTFNRNDIYLKGTPRPESFRTAEENLVTASGSSPKTDSKTERPNQSRLNYDRKRPPAKPAEKVSEPKAVEGEQTENRRPPRQNQQRRDQNFRPNQNRPVPDRQNRQNADNHDGVTKAADIIKSQIDRSRTPDTQKSQGERPNQRPQNQRFQNDRQKPQNIQNQDPKRQSEPRNGEKADTAESEKRNHMHRNRRGNRPHKSKDNSGSNSGGEKVNNS